MNVYAVPLGGKRVTVDNLFSASLPYGLYYSTDQDKFHIFEPEDRINSYGSGSIFVDDDVKTVKSITISRKQEGENKAFLPGKFREAIDNLAKNPPNVSISISMNHRSPSVLGGNDNTQHGVIVLDNDTVKAGYTTFDVCGTTMYVVVIAVKKAFCIGTAKIDLDSDYQKEKWLTALLKSISAVGDDVSVEMAQDEPAKKIEEKKTSANMDIAQLKEKAQCGDADALYTLKACSSNVFEDILDSWAKNYIAAYRKWQRDYSAAVSERNEEIEKEIQAEAKKYIEQGKQKFESKKNEIIIELTDLQEKKRKLQEKLSTLSVFSFKEKNKTRELIELCEKKIYEKQIIEECNAREDFKKYETDALSEAEKKRTKFENRYDQCNPLPVEPVFSDFIKSTRTDIRELASERLDRIEPGINVSKNQARIKEERELLKKGILVNMERDVCYSISDMRDTFDCFGMETTNSQVRGLITELEKEGKIERIYERREVVYRLL